MDFQKIEELRQKHADVDRANRTAIRDTDNRFKRPRLIKDGFVSRGVRLRHQLESESFNDILEKLELSRKIPSPSALLSPDNPLREVFYNLSRERNRPSR